MSISNIDIDFKKPLCYSFLFSRGMSSGYKVVSSSHNLVVNSKA
jgi:hypothetical protein